jgi:type III secretion system chaperone SycN
VTWVHDTLADFGRQLGIDGLGFGNFGVAQLQLQSGAIIAVEPVRRLDLEEVLVYLGRRTGHQMATVLRKAMAKTHYSQGGAFPVQVGVVGAGPDAMLVALVRMPERAFTSQSLSHAVDYLTRWLDDAERG